ncbi:MAG: HEAT repeat domain-containing protein, partial [Hyphomicrobiaceae bacterium]|nr:HEAT repeat domain-containing protein [Hyphomicrobiaceae bacterium]
DDAVRSLVACGPQAADALAEALEDERGSVRRQAAITLGRLGPDASGAIGALATALGDDGDETVRQAAAMALASIGGEGIDTLAKALRSDNEIVGRAAVSALLSIGPMARPAIGELTGALANEDSRIRVDSARSLGRMGAQARSAAVALGRMIETSSDKPEIWAAAGALARLGPAAIPALSGLLESDDTAVRSAAAVALAAIGPGGNAVLTESLTPEDIPGLVEIFQCTDMQMFWWVAHALEIVGPSAVPAMSEALIAGEDNVQLAVLGALIRMKKDSEAAVGALIEVLEDENQQVRRYAIYAMLHMGSRARSAVPAIVDTMNTTDDDMMCHPATRFLGGFGPEVAFVTDDLINALRRDHPAITRVAGSALSRMGPAAIPALVKGLGDEHPEVRCGCAMALSQMETDTTDVLLEVLAEGDDLARVAAADTFGRMGPSAIGVTGALEKIINDEKKDQVMRAAAQSALRRIMLDDQNPAASAVTASGEPVDIAPGGRLRAFPEAEGFGAFSVGGRGGRVIMVTNLYDSGPGSFRAACEAAGPRIVVFRVSGVIELQNHLDIREPHITIAGQSAPGGGICLKNYRFAIMDTHDVIVHHIRVRKGNLTRQSGDVMDIFNSYNVIVDHCSMSWGTDETVSSSADLEITIQWCMITEGLPDGEHVEKTHGKGSLLLGDHGGISLHHNIYAHHERRCPRVGGVSEEMPGIVLDCRNNVVYNWGDMSGQSTVCPVKINYVGNYLKPGASTWPESRGFAFYPLGPLTKLFVADNLIEGYPEKDADNWQMVAYEKGGSEAEVRVDAPFDVPPVHTETPRGACRSVLQSAGAILPVRDAVDARIVADIRGGDGEIVDSQWWVGGWPYYRQVPPPTDTDYDGMPDTWERKHGLNPNDPADNSRDADADGYTNIEEYLNSI